ncbi:MAG: hypothetical protein OXH99_00555 [Bryobacterales bacterium]|nr:hypothetical protein [Bryobacterales bacterium]
MKDAFSVPCRLLAVAVLAVLAVPSAVEATDLRLSDIRILGGDGIGLEDTPPEAWLAGVALGIEEGRRLRVSLEFLHGQIYGWDYYERRRILITPVFEYRFWPERRVQPYLGGGVGLVLAFNQWPTGENDELEWEWGPGIAVTWGGGVRLFLTERLFIAPDIRMGFYPFLQSTVGIGYRF